jgi:hypothetical protein
MYCRTDRADTADQLRHLVVTTADDQLFKETRRLKQAHCDIVQTPVLEQQLNPTVPLKTR